MNIYKLGKTNVHKFTVYNLGFQKKNATLSGHYTIYVDLDSHYFVAYKIGDFGSLSWYPKVENPKPFDNLSDRDYQELEGIIALAFWKSYIWEGMSRKNNQNNPIFVNNELTELDKQAIEYLD